MAKIKKVANGEYIGANKYTIKDAGGGKSTVDFAPDSVLTPGTEVGAELLNEMQLNALYTLDTNRVVEGQKEVYVANLEGFTDFIKPDLSFYLKINANNTNVQTYLRLDTTDYLIKCIPNDLTKNNIVACRKAGNEIIILNNYMQRQDDAILGGLYGGGKIEDPDVIKEVGKMYIGADGKAYICLVPSNINNAENYMPCNVADNLIKTVTVTATKIYDIEYESKYRYTFPTPKRQVISVMPHDVSFASSESGTCVDNRNVEVSATRFGPNNPGETNQTLQVVVNYIE